MYSVRTTSRWRRFQTSIQSRHSVRAVPTQRLAYAFALAACGGVLIVSIPAAANTASNAAANLAVAIADEEPELAGTLVEVHQQVPGSLGHPRPGGMGGDTGQVDPTVLQFDHKRYIQPG